MPIVLLVAGALLGIAWGLWRERRWARPLAVGLWAAYTVAVAIGAATHASSLSALLFGSGMLLWTSWYLYARPDVRAYYSALPRRPLATHRDGPPSPPPAVA